MKRILFFVLITVIAQNVLFSQPNSALPKIPFKSSEHWIFRGIQDTLTGNWSRISPLPHALYGVLSYYWQDSSKVFICGGADSNGLNSRNSYFYDITSNTYTPKPFLPVGRAFGKLVRVKDSLYLVGSIGTNFHLPDGAIYKFAPGIDTAWILTTTSPAPLLQEMAVCVWRDSLIFTIGGSSDGFTGVTNIVRSYDPSTGLWMTNIIPFPQNVGTADAECSGDDFLVVGGFDGTVLNTIYKGTYFHDSLNWEAIVNDSTAPFRQGIYRVGGGVINNLMLFGPGLRDTASYGQIWGYYSPAGPWVQFLPNTIDTAGNRPEIAVKGGTDSLFFYLFGGILPGLDTIRITANSERYSIINPFIGIRRISGTVPKNSRLYQNYPNPFNPSTIINYDIPKASVVKITVIDILGREVYTLVNEFKPAGSYKVEFNAGQFASGIYFYRMIAGGYLETKKMILLK